MRVILTGYKGMLGSEFMSLLKDGHEVFGFDYEDCDITDYAKIEQAFSGLKNIDFLINCAAYTAVDKVESEKELALAVNARGVKNLAEYCQKNKIVLVHFSTDYVFNGQKIGAYNEEDPTDPINYYGYTKLAGEQEIQKILKSYFIFRIQWLYGQHGKNFVAAVLKKAEEKQQLRVVDDQWGSPSWARDIARCVLAFIPQKKFGIYHLANQGYTNWYEFAKYFLKLQKIENEPTPVPTSEYVTIAKRPLNSRLEMKKYLNNIGLDAEMMPMSWQEAIELHLKNEGINK